MGVWVTAEGERIPFSELTDDHLVNIVKFLEKKAPEMHKKAMKRYEDAYMEAKAEAEDYVFSWATSPKHKRKLEHLRNRLNKIMIADPRNPSPYPGASPYNKLVEMAKQRGLLPADYDWMTPIREQQRDMEKMARLSFAYGHENPFEGLFAGRQQGKTSALEQAVLDARVKMAELQANPPLVMEAGPNTIRFVPHQSIQPGDALVIGGAGPFFVGNVLHDHFYVWAGGKPVIRSTTRKLRK